VIPAVFVGQTLIQQATAGAQAVEARVVSGEWRRALEHQPRLAPWVRRIDRNIDLPGLATSLNSWLTTTAGSLVRGSFLQAIDFCLTFYLLFFFLRDRDAAIAFLRSASPVSDDATHRLLGRVGDTVHAGVYGSLAVAGAQGLLGGLMFWWLGLPAPLLWGVIMALLAVFPVLGAFVVWIPATLYLALEGSWGKATILAVWGMLVVGTIDNLLRPVLVGNRLKLHTVLTFLSVVGGIMLFGPVGILLGPVILTLTTSLLEAWPRQPIPPAPAAEPATPTTPAPGTLPISANPVPMKGR
jgi:predicted PurR-regulated permease PerM